MPKSPPSSRSNGDVRLTIKDNPFFNLAITLFTGTVSDHGFKRKEFHVVPVLEPKVEDGKHSFDEFGDVVMVPKTTEVDGEQVPMVEDHEVGRKFWDKVSNEPIEYADITRKVETEYGFVYVTDEEIETLLDLEPKTIEIQTFQPIHLFHQGHYVPKKIEFVEPTKLVKGKAKLVDKKATELFTVLLQAMRDEGAIAVCNVVTRGKPKPAILLPDGSLWYVFHTEELREQRPLPEVEVTEGHVAQGRQLVQKYFTTEPVDLEDKRSSLILAFAAEKAEAGDFSKPDETAITVEPVVSSDLDAILGAALEGAKSA